MRNLHGLDSQPSIGLWYFQPDQKFICNPLCFANVKVLLLCNFVFEFRFYKGLNPQLIYLIFSTRSKLNLHPLCFGQGASKVMNSILFSLYASSLHAPHMSGSAGGFLSQHATRIRALQQHKSRSTVRFFGIQRQPLRGKKTGCKICHFQVSFCLGLVLSSLVLLVDSYFQPFL